MSKIIDQNLINKNNGILIIEECGSYVVGEDIIGQILIRNSNFIDLDLNNKTVYLLPHNHNKNHQRIGICVYNTSNLTIKNGCVSGFATRPILRAVNELWLIHKYKKNSLIQQIPKDLMRYICSKCVCINSKHPQSKAVKMLCLGCEWEYTKIKCHNSGYAIIMGRQHDNEILIELFKQLGFDAIISTIIFDKLIKIERMQNIHFENMSFKDVAL